MDADLKAVELEQQAIQPFQIMFGDIAVPSTRHVSIETQAMMDAGYLKESSFDVIVRLDALQTLKVELPQVNDEVSVSDDFATDNRSQPYTIKKASYDTVGVSWQYTLEIKE